MGCPPEVQQKVRDFAEDVRAAIPTELWKRGERSHWIAMRAWFEAFPDPEALEELSFRIALLTVCTNPALRKPNAQKEALALIATEGALKTLRSDHPSWAKLLKARRVEERALFDHLALELVRACRSKALHFDSERKCWRLT